MSSDPNADDDAIATVVESLTKKFPDIAEDVITEQVHQAHAPMVDAPLQEYVPVLVEHQAQVRLNDIEHDGESTTDSTDHQAPVVAD